MMRILMILILLIMLGSILSILVIKPFSQGGNSNNQQPPRTIQQPEPSK